jgi:DNA-binding IclR family transcriptional regulator
MIINRRTNKRIVLATFIGAMFIVAGAFAATGETIRVLKISSQDQRAVIKQSDGTMRIVKVGNTVGDYGTITEIAPGRVVLEKVSDKESERIIIRLEKGEQRIERIKRSTAKQPALVTPNAVKNR